MVGSLRLAPIISTLLFLCGKISPPYGFTGSKLLANSFFMEEFDGLGDRLGYMSIHVQL